MEIIEWSGARMIKLFTHTDLDGVGCAIVGNLAFGDNINIEYCGYNDIDQKVVDFFKNHDIKEYDAIFITDISVSEKVAKMIESIAPDRVVLLDHHATAEKLNVYEWANVIVTEHNMKEKRNQLTSGTSLFFNYLNEQGLIQLDDFEFEEAAEFVEEVRRYDCWEWKNVYGDYFAKELNDLFGLLGRYKFVDRFSKNCSINLNKTEKTLLEIERKRVDYYLNTKRRELVKREFWANEVEYFTIGVVFVEQYHSEVGNVLADENPDCEFIVMITPGSKKLSFRRNEKNDVHLGRIAELFVDDNGRTGGGHPPAAGASFKSKQLDEILNTILFLGVR